MTVSQISGVLVRRLTVIVSQPQKHLEMGVVYKLWNTNLDLSIDLNTCIDKPTVH